jgi:hypothetical protein
VSASLEEQPLPRETTVQYVYVTSKSDELLLERIFVSPGGCCKLMQHEFVGQNRRYTTEKVSRRMTAVIIRVVVVTADLKRPGG